MYSYVSKVLSINHKVFEEADKSEEVFLQLLIHNLVQWKTSIPVDRGIREERNQKTDHGTGKKSIWSIVAKGLLKMVYYK